MAEAVLEEGEDLHRQSLTGRRPQSPWLDVQQAATTALQRLQAVQGLAASMQLLFCHTPGAQLVREVLLQFTTPDGASHTEVLVPATALVAPASSNGTHAVEAGQPFPPPPAAAAAFAASLESLQELAGRQAAVMCYLGAQGVQLVRGLQLSRRLSVGQLLRDSFSEKGSLFPEPLEISIQAVTASPPASAGTSAGPQLLASLLGAAVGAVDWAALFQQQPAKEEEAAAASVGAAAAAAYDRIVHREAAGGEAFKLESKPAAAGPVTATPGSQCPAPHAALVESAALLGAACAAGAPFGGSPVGLQHVLPDAKGPGKGRAAPEDPDAAAVAAPAKRQKQSKQQASQGVGAAAEAATAAAAPAAAPAAPAAALAAPAAAPAAPAVALAALAAPGEAQAAAAEAAAGAQAKADAAPAAAGLPAGAAGVASCEEAAEGRIPRCKSDIQLEDVEALEGLASGMAGQAELGSSLGGNMADSPSKPRLPAPPAEAGAPQSPPAQAAACAAAGSAAGDFGGGQELAASLEAAGDSLVSGSVAASEGPPEAAATAVALAAAAVAKWLPPGFLEGVGGQGLGTADVGAGGTVAAEAAAAAIVQFRDTGSVPSDCSLVFEKELQSCDVLKYNMIVPKLAVLNHWGEPKKELELEVEDLSGNAYTWRLRPQMNGHRTKYVMSGYSSFLHTWRLTKGSILQLYRTPCGSYLAASVPAGSIQHAMEPPAVA